VLDLVRADVLGDASGLARRDVRGSDGVEQARLAVVDVTENCDDRRTLLELRGVDVLPQDLLRRDRLGSRLLLRRGAASSSARVSKPSSFATSVAVSKSTDWLIETIVPMFTSPRITSTTLTSSARARSPTMIVFGRVTTVEVSATATGATGSGIGWGMGAR